MAIRVLLLKEFRVCLGRLWRLTFTAAWSGLQKVAGSGPPLSMFRGTPASEIAEVCEQQRFNSLRTIAEQVSVLQEERSGRACRSVQAKLTGNRQATLRALEAGYPDLRRMSSPDMETFPDRIDCLVRQDAKAIDRLPRSSDKRR